MQLPSDEVGGPHEDGGWLGEEDLSELSSDTLDVYFPAALMPGRVQADVRYWLPPRPLAHSPPPKSAAAVGDVARNRSDTQSRSEATESDFGAKMNPRRPLGSSKIINTVDPGFLRKRAFQDGARKGAPK